MVDLLPGVHPSVVELKVADKSQTYSIPPSQESTVTKRKGYENVSPKKGESTLVVGYCTLHSCAEFVYVPMYMYLYIYVYIGIYGNQYK